jgi:sporulation protein YlmC with PRC-barrel domain
MKRISELVLLKVVTKSGKMLGHVYDFHSPGEPEAGQTQKERIIKSIAYGETGLLERLGLIQVAIKTIPWSDVLEVKGNKVIIKDQA